MVGRSELIGKDPSEEEQKGDLDGIDIRLQSNAEDKNNGSSEDFSLKEHRDLDYIDMEMKKKWKGKRKNWMLMKNWTVWSSNPKDKQVNE